MSGDSAHIFMEPSLDLNGPLEGSVKMVALSKNVEKQEASESDVFIVRKMKEDRTIYPHGCCSQAVEKVETAVGQLYLRHRTLIGVVFKVLIFMLYMAYFIYCLYHRLQDEGSYILTGITALFLLKIVVSWVGRRYGGRLGKFFMQFKVWYSTTARAHLIRKVFRYGLYLAATVLLTFFLGMDISTNFNQSNGQAILGIFSLVLLCYIFSYKPSQVHWHPVFWGFIMQFAFAALTLRTEPGSRTFKWVGDLVDSWVRKSDKGSTFVLGASFLADKAGFFFECAGILVFYNACIFLLEYYGVLEFLVLKIGRVLALCLETGPVESAVAAANIFIGQAEAPLLVRPYLPTVTRSELHAIMTCGFSSISGAFMAMFIKAGVPPSHMLTAAVISAPAAIAITKLMYPEVDQVNYASQRNIHITDKRKQRNALQVFADGAHFSIKQVAAIMVNMMAFVSMLSLIDATMVWLGQRVGMEGLSFQWLCSYLFYPLSFLMGIHPDDCRTVGGLIGLKLIASIFVAYSDFGQMIKNRQVLENYLATTTNGSWHWMGNNVVLDSMNLTLPLGVMHARSEVITTYALCGFSAFPAIGVTLSTLIHMSPERKNDVVSVIIRAFIAGNLANIATGSVAGLMYHDS